MSVIRRLFGNIFNRRTPLENAPSSGRNVDPKKIRIKRVGYAFVRGGGTGSRAQFEGPDFDLEDVERAYNTDGYVRQALDKYTELMFKAGWALVGKNENAVEYVKLRLAAMAMSTGQPIDEFFVEVADNLVKYANVFIVKARQRGTNAGYQIPGISARGITGKDPIAGYFVLPATTMEIARDQHGTVVKYQQRVSGANEPIEFNPEDIIHIYYKKPTGRGFGVPFAMPVLDDVRLLREVEENVARLIYRNLHPLYVYQVGLAQAGFEATEEEIEAVRSEIEDMPTDGGIVLPERHKIEAVGAEGEALDAKEYLAHYERRVFTGLGVSEVVMGRGSTANRSTADNMTSEMHDRIKALQKVYSIGIDSFIINELLMEGGFDPIANEDDDVDFKFNEIALDEKIKLENHEIFKFEHNAQTFEEMRSNINMDPVTDEGRLYFNMIQKALAEVKAEATSTAATDNKNKPTNQHGTKLSPKKESLQESSEDILRVDEYANKLLYQFHLAREDVIDLIKKEYFGNRRKFPEFEPKEIEMVFSMVENNMKGETGKYIRNAIIEGSQRAKEELGIQRSGGLDIDLYSRIAQERVHEYIENLLQKTLNVLSKRIKESNEKNIVSNITGAFNAMEYRLRFIADTELNKALNYGFSVSGAALGRDSVYIKSSNQTSDCKICKNMMGKKVELSGDPYRDIPPWHPNCKCQLTFLEPS